MRKKFLKNSKVEAKEISKNKYEEINRSIELITEGITEVIFIGTARENSG